MKRFTCLAIFTAVLLTAGAGHAQVAPKKMSNPGMPWSSLLPKKPLTAGRNHEAA